MTVYTCNCEDKQDNKDMVIEIKITGINGNELGKKCINISTGDVVAVKADEPKKEEKPVEETKKEEPKKKGIRKRGDSAPKISNTGFLFYFACGIILQLMLYMAIGVQITEIPTYLIVVMWFVFTFVSAMVCEILKTFLMCIFY